MQSVARYAAFVQPMHHVNLLSYHAFGSWLPGRKQGYFRNKSGIRPTNPAAADWYRHVQHRESESFVTAVQQCMIDACEEAEIYQRFELYGVATDPSHLHVLVAWDDDRLPSQMRRNLKQSLTRNLNQTFCHRQWFSRGGNDRRVRDRDHFLYSRDEYLPDHPGWKWDRRIGKYVQERSLLHLRLS